LGGHTRPAVWIEYLRGAAGATPLEGLLLNDSVATHPWIVGELAMGSLGPARTQLLADVALLPRATTVEYSEVLELVEARRLAGSGLGWVDAQLLASALVSDLRLWTLDRALHTAADRLGVSRPVP
jgi:predicted nucleic acid-binding protein